MPPTDQICLWRLSPDQRPPCTASFRCQKYRCLPGPAQVSKREIIHCRNHLQTCIWINIYRELRPAFISIVFASPLHAHAVVALGHVKRGIGQVENADIRVVVLRAVTSTSLFSEYCCPRQTWSVFALQQMSASNAMALQCIALCWEMLVRDCRLRSCIRVCRNPFTCTASSLLQRMSTAFSY